MHFWKSYDKSPRIEQSMTLNKNLIGDYSVRQRSYALPSFDRKEPLVTLSLEELQEISQEGLFYGVHKTPFGNVVGVVFQNRLCGLVFQGNVRSEYLVEQDFNKLGLTVDVDNEPAIHLYRSIGFKPIEYSRNEYGKGHNRYIMEWDLIE